MVYVSLANFIYRVNNDYNKKFLYNGIMKKITIDKSLQIQEHVISKATKIHPQTVYNTVGKFLDRLVNSLAPSIGYEQAVLQASIILNEPIEVIVKRLKKETLENLKAEVRRRLNDEQV